MGLIGLLERSGALLDETTLCIVGLGYVGLPLAIAFDQVGVDVIGYDTDSTHVQALQTGVDPTGEMGDRVVAESRVQYTTDETTISGAEYVLVAVPTPINEFKKPDLESVEDAGRTIGRNVEPGTTVVLESTVYPGATRSVLAPAIEETSDFDSGIDFQFGYSPERMVPGDDEHGLRNVSKIVSGNSDEVARELEELYSMIVDASIHVAPKIEVAETAKCIENIQRDVNIALMNELAIACDALEIDTHDVLTAARTKWNFHDYRPGLVGGHCIPVDPFFLIYESERNGYTPDLIEQSREINEYIPKHVAEVTLRGLNSCEKILRDSTVAILGLSYKPNVGDIRTSVVGATIERLQEYDVQIVGVDAHADPERAREQFGIPVQSQPSFDGIDAVLLATPHDEFLSIDFVKEAEVMADRPLIMDVDGVLNPSEFEQTGLEYRRL